MAQDYQVLQFKQGNFQDNFGNYWCDMALEGVGEPVRIVVKDPAEYRDGMTLYGHIENATSKAGKPYLRFKREKKEDGQFQGGSQSPSAPSKSGYKTDDATQESIARSVALKAAVDYVTPHVKGDLHLVSETTLEIADKFLAWLQGNDKPPMVSEGANDRKDPPLNPKKPWENRKPSSEPDPEWSGDSFPFEGENINIDELPLA